MLNLFQFPFGDRNPELKQTNTATTFKKIVTVSIAF